jgi:hypothetical protein
MTSAHKLTAGMLAGALLLVALCAVGMNVGHKRLLNAERDAEAAKLALAHQVVAQEETRRELQGSVTDLLQQNADLRTAYEAAKAAAPDSQVTEVASLKTGNLKVQEPEQDLEILDPGSEPVPVPNCPTGEILFPDRRGGFVCGPPESALPVQAKACVLHSGDAISMTVDQITLGTPRGNSILAGAASAWRESPTPRALLASGKFESYLSSTGVLAAPAPPRWGVELAGLCQSRGCGPGVGVLFPPWTLPVLGWRTEARAGAFLGPEWAVLGGLGVRF